MRRIFIIATILVLLLGGGIVAYFTLRGGRPTVTVALQNSDTGLPVAGKGTVPQPGEGKSDTGSAAQPSPSPVPVTSRLVKVSAGPVVYGLSIVDQKTATASSSPTTNVSYIERQSGNIFSYSVQTRTATRTSNRTVPGIQSALWHPSGSTAYVRYLSGSDFSTINTFALPASGIGGFFLPQNTVDLDVSSTSILILASGVNGSTATVARVDGTHAVSAFSTPLTSIRASYLGRSQYLVVTKATATLPGAAFVVDASGSFSRLIGPLPGLSALASPSGKWVFATYTSGSDTTSELVNVATGDVIPVPLATLAEKCAWSADESSLYCGVPRTMLTGTYPDDWYQGVLHFTDRLWRINVAGRYAQLVADVSNDADTPIDITSLTINRSGTVVAFVNKNDASLWVYSL
ncbi:MAG TPA: hypothetical protein VFP46_00700 [Candidatus Paceibacterota bacterium]|nr:hypothetical protein [Candidatus Paceibacterota bacterium]